MPVFTVTPCPSGLSMRFSSTLGHLDRAVEESTAFLLSQNAQGSLFEVKLLLREALLNAVLHGNAQDATRTVRLDLLPGDGRLTLEVEDQGPGFDWRSGLASQAPPEATSGRGLTILKLYADDVHFNAAGNKVILTKAVPGLRRPDTVSEDTADDTPRSTSMHDIRIEDGHTVLCPDGDIVASVTDDLRARLKDVLDEQSQPLVIDLKRVGLIDSVGIGLLIATHNTLSKKGQRLTLTNVNADLAGLLRTMRLDKHFTLQTA